MSESGVGAGVRWLAGRPPRWPWVTIVVALVLAALAAVGTSRLTPSASMKDLLGRSDPAAAALDRVMERFPQADDLFILLTEREGAEQARPEDAAADLFVFAERLKGRLLEDERTRGLCVGVALALDPELRTFLSDELIPAALFYVDDATLDAVAERLTPAAMQEQVRQNEAMIAAPGPAAGALAKQFIQDPLRLREFLSGALAPDRSGVRTWRGGPEFISADGRAVLMRVSGARPATDLEFCKGFTAAVRAVVEDEGPSAAGVRAELSGAYAIAAASATSIRSDAIASVVGSVLLLQALFLVVYRRVLSFGLAFAPVALGILLAFGGHSIFSDTLTPLTAVIGAVLAGLGIDFCIHYLSHYEATRLEAGPSVGAAEVADSTLRHIGLPLAAAGITSVHGFLAVAFSGAAVLRDFALVGAAGLACALLATVTVLPAMLALLDRAGWGRRGERASVRVSFAPVVGMVARRPRRFAGVMGVVLVVFGGVVAVRGLPRLETDLSVMHPRPNPALETHARIAELFGGVADPLIIHIAALTEEELVARAHEVRRALASGGERESALGSVFGLASLLPDPSRVAERGAKLDVMFDPGRVTGDFQAAVNESLFEPMMFGTYTRFLARLVAERSPPSIDTLRGYPALAGNVLAAPMLADPPGPAEAITLAFPANSLDDRAARDAVVVEARERLAAIPGVTLTGMSVVAHDIEATIRRDIPRVLLICGAAVVLTILVIFRRGRDLAMILLPVVFGAAGVLAYMGLAGERLNMANMVAMPLLMGICVDYAIFTVGLARRTKGAELLARLGASVQAMTMTSATTMIGFGTLAFTSVPAIQSLGRLVVVGVAASLAGTLLLLVPILIMTHRPGDTGAEGGRPA